MNIKYIGEDGKVHFLNTFIVNNVTIAQTKGESEEYVMSQKAVSTELDKLQKNIEDIDVSEQLKDCAKLVDYEAEEDEKEIPNAKTFNTDNFTLVLDSGKY